MSEPIRSHEEILRLVSSICSKSAALRYLVILLMHANRLLHPTVLRHGEDLNYYCNDLQYALVHCKYEHVLCEMPASRHEVIDARTLAECLRYLSYLKSRLDDSDGIEDTPEQRTWREEYAKLLHYLSHSVNRHGKPYAFVTQRENDRTCVYRALMRLVEKVRETDPELADYIKAHIVYQGGFMWRE